MDILLIKGRIALALVESIFRRAGLQVTPVGPLEVPPHLGREDLPDFAIGRADGDPGLARRRLVEVRYRVDLSHYLAIESQRGPRSRFGLARRHWPDLDFVFVTDRPEPGRSSFQVLGLTDWQPGRPFETVDLFGAPHLGIYRHNVDEHETLLRRIFGLLTGGP